MRFFSIFLIFLLFTGLWADEKEAMSSFREARTREAAKKPYKAAKLFMEAKLYSDDAVIKANCLMNAARCYRKAGFYGDEFDCLQELIKRHLSLVDFTSVMDRQFEIAELFARGHRDPWHPWIPFIRQDSRSKEIMKKVLENAPCAKQAGAIRLRLARIYLEDQEIPAARKELQETIRLYPGTEEARLASLEMANLCLQQAERGDGSGKYAKETTALLEEFEKQYPDDTEIEWVRHAKKRIYNKTAERYYQMALYYNGEGRKDVAQRYLATVIRDFPDSKEAPAAEAKLAELDQGYKISRREWVPTHLDFQMRAFPKEQEKTLITPQDSGNRYLLPIRDLKSNYIQQDPDKKKEVVTDEML